MPPHLGEFEQLVLLAVLKLEDRATGAAIREAVEDGSRRRVWIGAVYTTLHRLDDKGLVRASVSDVPAEGARPRKIYALTAPGRVAVSHAVSTWARMTRGLKPKLELLP
jgi:DNA-binding PadR family transcriptional regulator